MQGSGLAPGSYRHKDLLQETLNKTISIRGPYDLCSGPRIPSHKRGKANPLLAPGRYEIQPYTEMLKGKRRVDWLTIKNIIMPYMYVHA